MTINVNFGGFYESDHSYSIDFFIENEQEYYLNEYENKDKLKKYLNDNNLEFWELYNYKEIYKDYSKMYIELFNNWLTDNEISIQLEFSELVSPKYYNYSTDSIIAKTNKLKKHQLIKLIQNEHLNNEHDLEAIFEERVHDVTKTVSGYIAFYDYDNVINMIDKEHKDVYIECLFKVLCDVFNEWLLYSDIHEDLYQFIRIESKHEF